jgi:hypothetical protein
MYRSYFIGLIAALGACSDSDLASFTSNPASNTYICSCVCNSHVVGQSYTQIDNVPPIQQVSVCAPDTETAKGYCPAACQKYLEDFYRETQTWVHTVVDSCKLSPKDPSPVTVKAFGVCKQDNKLRAATPSHADFEGPVDTGLSYLNVELPRQDDGARIKVSGKLSIVGGNCPNAECPIALWYVFLQPISEVFSSKKGHSIAGLTALNEGIWRGTKHSDGTFELGTDSKISLSASIDGKHGIMTFNPNSYIRGKIFYNASRKKDNYETTNDNSIVVDGRFLSDSTVLDLHLETWLTSCQPRVEAIAQCWTGIDYEGEYVLLNSNYSLLGNLKSHDLCNAVRPDKGREACTSSGDVEFPSFSCQESQLPSPTDTSSVAQRLRFRWEDAKGKPIGSHATETLSYMPEFPLRLTIRNEWGREVSAEVAQPPSNSGCPSKLMMPPPMPPHGFERFGNSLSVEPK